MKITYEIVDKNIIASTTYHGKIITATAKCHPDDIFDANIGIKLSTTKLKYKYAKAKYKQAVLKYNLALDEYDKVMMKALKAENFYLDACDQLKLAKKDLKNTKF